MIRGMEYLSCNENLRELELCCLKKRRVWGEVMVDLQYLMGTSKKVRKNNFSRDCYKLTEDQFRLDLIKKFHNEGGETWTDCPERGRCPTPGNIPDQAGWVSEQPHLVEDVPAH